MLTFRKTIFWITLFSIAMGYMESAVVVYLRALYYPEGFSFPLQPITEAIALTEIYREAATIIMLVVIGIVTGRSNMERFAWFIYCFAVWDIFYYVFLKLLLGWPESFLTWDILFLIPLTWVGPVLAPIIISITMILLASVIIYPERVRNIKVRVKGWDWLLFISGSLIVIISFTEEYTRFLLHHFTFEEIWSLNGNEHLLEVTLKYAPVNYRWWIFWLGEAIILGGIGRIYFRSRSDQS